MKYNLFFCTIFILCIKCTFSHFHLLLLFFPASVFPLLGAVHLNSNIIQYGILSLIISHLHSCFYHLRNKDKRVKLTEGYIWQRQCSRTHFPSKLHDSSNERFHPELIRKIVLVFMNSSWFICESSKLKPRKSVLLFKAILICLSVLPLLINYYIGDLDNELKRMMQSSIPSFLFPGRPKCLWWVDCKTNNYVLIQAFSYEPSRTSVMLRHVEECFDFRDIWARAGPTSILPAVWLQYQTTLLNYSVVLDQKILFLCCNQDRQILDNFFSWGVIFKSSRLYTTAYCCTLYTQPLFVGWLCLDVINLKSITL